MRLSVLLALALCACSEVPLAHVDAGSDAGADAGQPPDGGAADGGTDGGLPVKAACLTLDTQRCDYLIRCGLLVDSDAQRRECISWLSATWCGPSTWPSRVDPHVGTLKYDPAAGAACAAAFETRDCAQWATEPTPCQHLVQPAALSGQACYDGYQECVQGVCRGGACPRSCQPPGALGDVCRLAADCRPTLFCKLSNVASGLGACAAPGGLNAFCGSDAPCGSGFTCAASRCVVPPEAGLPCAASLCDPGAWCQSGPDGGMCLSRSGLTESCNDDVQCLPELLCLNNQCAPRALSDAGTPCDARQQCPAPTVCVGATASASGNCEPPRAAAQGCAATTDCQAHLACTVSDGGLACGPRHPDGTPCTGDRDCQAFSRCVSGQCQHLPSTGQACEAGRNCLLGPCAQQADGGGLCVEPYGPGVTCARDEECTSKHCVSGQCLFSCAP